MVGSPIVESVAIVESLGSPIEIIDHTMDDSPPIHHLTDGFISEVHNIFSELTIHKSCFHSRNSR